MFDPMSGDIYKSLEPQVDVITALSCSDMIPWEYEKQERESEDESEDDEVVDSTRAEIQAIWGESDWIEKIAVGSDDGKVEIWDVDGSGVSTVHSLFSQPIRSLSLSEEGDLIIAGTDSGEVKVWDIQSAKSIYQIDNEKHAVTAVEFLSGRLEAAIGFENGEVYQTNWFSGTLLGRYQIDSWPVNCLSYNNVSESLIYGDESGMVYMLEPLRDSSQTSLPVHGNRVLFAGNRSWSPDWFLLTTEELVILSENGHVKYSENLRDLQPRSMSLASDRSWALISGRSGVILYNLDQRAVKRTFPELLPRNMTNSFNH